MILLDTGAFVIDVQRRNHAIGNHPRAKWSGSALSDPTLEDQLNFFRTTDIEVFANHLFKENPAADGPVQNLSEG